MPAVRAPAEAEEEEDEPRALPYPLICDILDALPDVTRPKGGTIQPGSRTKARLWVMAWTGLAHTQLMRLRPEDVDWEGCSVWVRGRLKGRSGRERRGQRKPITEEAVAALRRFDELGCWGSKTHVNLAPTVRLRSGRPQVRILSGAP